MSTTILPHQLPQALNDAPGVTTLSLDCFDTLLWRDVHRPVDLFKLLPVIGAHRIYAEKAARKSVLLEQRGTSEVTLRDIYKRLMPEADAATIEAEMAIETALEAQHCFAFAPTVALMQEAKRRGMQVIIVSDTYLQQDQLAELLLAATGPEVFGLIDRIFCSCDYGRSKHHGLFDDVLREIGEEPGAILHIGDNPAADYVGARRAGLDARHLIQFAGSTEERLRREAAAGRIMNVRSAGFQPHRATLSYGEPQIEDRAEALGFATLGPVLVPFARWISEEAKELAAASDGTVHKLFLLRDGHLPAAIFETLYPDQPIHRIEISRFTSNAAMMRTPAQATAFIEKAIAGQYAPSILTQLMFKPEEASAILGDGPHPSAYVIVDRLKSRKNLAKIASRGAAMADRLVEYVRCTVDPRPGDTLMLVDLGYNGTVQNNVADLLEERLGVKVAGRYVLLCEDHRSTLDKRGLLDASRLDFEALRMMTRSVAILEQLCTMEMGSVVDYAKGRPIRRSGDIKDTQIAIRDRIQAGAVRYAQVEPSMAIRPANPARPTVEIEGATGALTRLFNLPMAKELEILKDFEHDVNLNSSKMSTLFDSGAAASGLRARGLFYLRNSSHMFLPGEVVGQGLPTSLALLTQSRHDLDLRYGDFCDRRIAVPVMVVNGTKSFVETIDATPTHDGYFVADIPVGQGQYTIGLQFGRLYEWVEIDSLRFVPTQVLMSGEQLSRYHGQLPLPHYEGLTRESANLFRCEDDAAFLMVPPPEHAAIPMTLSVVFRPLVERRRAPQRQDLADAKGACAADRVVGEAPTIESSI